MPDAASMPPDVYAAALARQQQQQSMSLSQGQHMQQQQQHQQPGGQQYAAASASTLQQQQQQQISLQQPGAFMQQTGQGGNLTPQGFQQPSQFLPPQQHLPASTGIAAEAEPPVPGTEDGVVAKAASKAVAKPSYSAAPVLRAAATPAADDSAPQVQVCRLPCPQSASQNYIC